MTELVKYLEGVKVSKGIKSDRQLAGRIGITQTAMNNIMAGFSVPKDDTCLRIAELAGEDPAVVILLAHKSKASEGTKKHWARIFKAMTEKVAAAALGILILIGVALPGQISQGGGFDREYTLSDNKEY